MIDRVLHPEVVAARLATARTLLDHLASLGALDADRLAGDLGVRLQVERALTQLVEIAVDVNTHVVSALRGAPPADYRGSFTAAGDVGLLDRDLARRLEPSAGLRNVVVHQYLDVDLGVLAAATGRALVDYGDYVRAVARWLQDRQDAGTPPS